MFKEIENEPYGIDIDLCKNLIKLTKEAMINEHKHISY